MTLCNHVYVKKYRRICMICRIMCLFLWYLIMANYGLWILLSSDFAYSVKIAQWSFEYLHFCWFVSSAWHGSLSRLPVPVSSFWLPGPAILDPSAICLQTFSCQSWSPDIPSHLHTCSHSPPQRCRYIHQLVCTFNPSGRSPLPAFPLPPCITLTQLKQQRKTHNATW